MLLGLLSDSRCSQLRPESLDSVSGQPVMSLLMAATGGAQG